MDRKESKDWVVDRDAGKARKRQREQAGHKRAKDSDKDSSHKLSSNHIDSFGGWGIGFQQLSLSLQRQ